MKKHFEVGDEITYGNGDSTCVITKITKESGKTKLWGTWINSVSGDDDGWMPEDQCRLVEEEKIKIPETKVEIDYEQIKSVPKNDRKTKVSES